MPVLLQYAIDDGDIHLWEIWKERIGDTLDLIELMCRHPGGVCGFNLVFDWFHISKVYNVFRLCDRDWIPQHYIHEIACKEKIARDGVCLRPVKALDLFLHARKGRYQSTLDRKDIRIRKVPKTLALSLANELNKRIKLNDLYFARRKEKLANPWQVFDIKPIGSDIVDPDFKDIVLKFAPSSGLKALAVDAGLIGVDEVLKFTDVSVASCFNPEESGFAPFAEANATPEDWGRTWPAMIKYHIDHYACNTQAREYSRLDVVYTLGLFKYFDCPEPGDDDSELACAIATIRWKGLRVDIEALKTLKAKAVKLNETAPKSPGRVKEWLYPSMDEVEIESTKGSTAKVILEEIATWKKQCPDCEGEGNTSDGQVCTKCNNGEIEHPAATKSKLVLNARKAKKEIEIYDKLIKAGRFHASFKIIGTLSGRMAGADKLNPQAIKSTKEVRRCFPLAWDNDGFELCGGDFEAFEVVIAVAIYKDPKLQEDLNTFGLCPDCIGKKEVSIKDKQGNKTGRMKTCPGCNGRGETKKKIHPLFGQILYNMSYDEIVATKGSARDLYTESKRGVFSQLYGGNFKTLMDRLGLSEEIAIKASEGWANKYVGIKKAQQFINNSFGTMVQRGGIGSKIEWHEPAEYVESLLGFKRYYTLENKICRTLFDLAEKPPSAWTNLKVTVRRRDRDQTASGAVRSAVFGSAFQIQAANIRSACNHQIQATGSQICKNLQRRLWDLQPIGIHPWKIQVFNCHDEVMAPCLPELKPQVTKIVQECLNYYKPLIPMIAIDWSNDLKDWSDK